MTISGRLTLADLCAKVMPKQRHPKNSSTESDDQQAWKETALGEGQVCRGAHLGVRLGYDGANATKLCQIAEVETTQRKGKGKTDKKKEKKYTHLMKESKVAQDGVMQLHLVQRCSQTNTLLKQHGLVQVKIVKSPCCCQLLPNSAE